MRKFVGLEPPKDFDPRLYNILKNIHSALGQSQTGFARISRGEQPDGGGAPIIDESKFVLLLGRDQGQSVRGSNRIVGSTGITKLTLSAFNSASAANIDINNTDISLEGARMVFRAPEHDDEPLLLGFSTSGSPLQNWVGMVITGNILINASSASTNAFGIFHGNMPTTNVTAFVQRRSLQTGNLFEWRASGSPMSYIRSSDGAFVGPIVASGTDVHPDDVFQIVGSVDPTKIAMFEVDGITTATTRTITVPDWSGTVALFQSNKLRIGDTATPAHTLELLPGTTTVAPLVIKTGPLLTTPVAGAIEFLTNRLYSTSAIGPTRRIICVKANATPFGGSRIPYTESANGELTDSGNLFYTAGSNTLSVLNGTIKSFGTSSTIWSEGNLTAILKVLFGSGTSSPDIKVQADYVDTTTSANNIVGLSSYLRVQNASSSAANFIAMDGLALISGSPITSSGIGVGVVGLRGTIQINTGSAIDSVTGLTGLIYTENGNPTITNAYAVGVRWAHTSGTITNAYGIYIQDPASSATVTNNYMLYLENAQEGTTLNYSIYAAGGPSIHVGSLRLGDTTSGTHRLELLGGTTSVAPIKIDPSSGGVLLSSPVSGAVEYDGLHFYITHADLKQAPIASTKGAADLFAQAAAIGATTIFNPGGAGDSFLVTYYLECTTADAAAGTIQFQINYTDDYAAQTDTGALLSLAVTGRDRGSFIVWEGGSGDIKYQTNLVGIMGTAKYALHIRLVAL